MGTPPDPYADLRPPPPAPRPRRRRGGWTLRLTSGGAILLLVINVIILGALALGLNRLIAQEQANAPLPTKSPTNPLSATLTLSPSPTEEVILPSITPTEISLPASSPPAPAAIQSLEAGLILLAMQDGSHTHLFAYQPQAVNGMGLPLTRLTSGPWDDITPALSHDGRQVAFASNRNGYWDLYLLDLPSGQLERLTDSPEYEAAPSWSPDGLWIAYEAYQDENLEILIQPVTGAGEPVRLTNQASADHSPAWSPNGRIIAFVSDRSGESEIWLADLDKAESERYQNLSRNPAGQDYHPAWSPDGQQLAWSGEQEGFHNLYLWEAENPAQPLKQVVGSGDWPVYSPDGALLLSLVLAPNHTYLSAYPLQSAGVILPPLQLPGYVQGVAWGKSALDLPLREPYKQASLLTATPLYQVRLTAAATEQGGRYQLVDLEDIEAPFPQLHDQVDEAFQALRTRLAQESGWDLLAALENAFVPLTSPLDPGMGEDWLYTGRAFAFTSSPINAGWLAVVREDFGSQTYWRVYMRARFQDGSAGIPMHYRPWDLGARYKGDATIYEQGGKQLETVLPGYWIDVTQRALAYGWQRLPALSTWRASYPAARFNEFYLSDGLNWQSAMLELYPPDLLLPPPPVVPETPTPARTSRWYRSPTPTPTSTLRPTFTPVIPTPAVTLTPRPALPTSTPRPTATSES